MSAPEFLLTPDWVILGAPYKDGVMVIASDKLNQATVEMARDYFETMYDPFGGIHEKTPTYKLSTEMRQFTIAYGATYSEALSKLFGTWSPDGQDELPTGTRELSRGPSNSIAIIDEPMPNGADK